MLAPVPDAKVRADVVACVSTWIDRELATGTLLAAAEKDPTAPRWYLRMRGDEKEYVTVWLTLRQRTLHHEVQVMPAPEVNVPEVYEYLLRRNADIRGMAFALGEENAVYLVGSVPAERVDDVELDRILGGSLVYVDECWPTAMSMGFAGQYRRQRRRRNS